MGENVFNGMDARAQPENTVKSNRWAMTRLKGWLQKRQINVDLKHASGEDLAPILRRFYGEVKSTGGKVLTPSSLVGLRAGRWSWLILIVCVVHHAIQVFRQLCMFVQRQLRNNE